MDPEVLEEWFGDLTGEQSPPVKRPDRDGEPRYQGEYQAPPDYSQPLGRNEPDRAL
jgi:hypothetical protein